MDSTDALSHWEGRVRVAAYGVRHGVCSAILNGGNTWVSKALPATERDIARGKLTFFFTAPGAIVGNSKWKQILFELVAVSVLNMSAYSFRALSP